MSHTLFDDPPPPPPDTLAIVEKCCPKQSPDFYAVVTHGGQQITGYGDDGPTAIHNAITRTLTNFGATP